MLNKLFSEHESRVFSLCFYASVLPTLNSCAVGQIC